MGNYFVYLLTCSDGSYYIGVTNDLDRRVMEHNTGLNENCYTFWRRPLELKFVERFDDIEVAITFEKKLKGWTRAKKEALIMRNSERLKELAVWRNESFRGGSGT